MAKPDSTQCLHCGNTVMQSKDSGRIKKYCSSKCRSKYGQATRVVPVRSLECRGCGAVFTPYRNDKRNRWCSDACRIRGSGGTKRITDITHVCVMCLKAYHPTPKSTGKYCSRNCAYRDVGRRASLATPRRVEAKRAERLERNAGKYCEISIEPCICCGDRLVGPRPNRTWSYKFCSKCKRTLGNAVWLHVGRIDFLRARLRGRECMVCGGLFTPYQETTKVCSKSCEKQTDGYKRLRLAHKLKRNAKKRTNGPYDTIDPIAIFERDGWVCYLCGSDTPRSLRGLREDLAPEMDHVKPLAMGGTHTIDNVACCCRKCNQKKSDNLVVQVLDRWFLLPRLGTDKASWLQSF